MTITSEKEVQKLTDLIFSLRNTMEQVGTVADEVDDRRLRIALSGLADEGCNYADELRSQLAVLGISTWVNSEYFGEPGEVTRGENELQNLCNRFENYLANAYRSIISDSLSLPSIKQLLIYQYESIKAGFQKVRLLNETRPVA